MEQAAIYKKTQENIPKGGTHLQADSPKRSLCVNVENKAKTKPPASGYEWSPHRST